MTTQNKICRTAALMLCAALLISGCSRSSRYAENNLSVHAASLPVKTASASAECGDRELIFIPLQERFNALCQVREASYWVWDGIHPTVSGHQVIADAWMEAVGPALGLTDHERKD